MKKSNEYKPSKGLSLVTSNKKIAAGILVGLYLVIEGIAIFAYKANLEDAAYISQIISGIFVIGGLVVSVLQYTASNVDNMILRDKEKKIKAAEMANQFQAEIIPLSNVLATAYKKSGLDKTLLNVVEHTKLEMFDKAEVDQIIKNTNTDAANAYMGLCVGYLIDSRKINRENVDEKGKVSVCPEDRKEAENAIIDCVNGLSNKLEYFCICFNSGIADEDTVYQSLHNMFFQCVHMLYIFIFANNVSESDRLFSNVSSLYQRWHARYETLVEKEKEELINNKKNVQENIVVKAKK